MSTGVPRPYVPHKFRRNVFDSLHSLGHPSIRETQKSITERYVCPDINKKVRQWARSSLKCQKAKVHRHTTTPGVRFDQKLITERYVWPDINKKVRHWARSSLKCQKAKVHRHTVTPLGTFPTPGVRFDHVHNDIVGPLSVSQGSSYILTCIDRFTRWPEAQPMPDMTGRTVAQTFFNTWIAHFGVTSTVTTDRGQQFESALWSSLMQLLGCKRIRTTSYHPIANGMIECFHRQLKSILKSYPNTADWTTAMLGIRTTLKHDFNCTPAELVYGATPRDSQQMLTGQCNTICID